MIVRSQAAGGDDASLPDQYNTFDVDASDLETFLRTHRLTDLQIGFELRETPPKPKEEAKPEPGSLADRLAKLKAAKAGGGTGDDGKAKAGLGKLDKYEQRAKAAKEKQAAQEKKQKEAKEAKGYARKKRRWFGLGRAA
jgi:hypothetical protein